MKGHIFALSSMLAITALVALGALAIVRSVSGAGPVFPVAVVDAGLSAHPGAWVGRTIRVEGAIYGTWCDVTAPCSRMDGSQESLFGVAGGDRFVLASAQSPSPFKYDVGEPSLLLALGPPNPLLATLRRLPFVGGLSPEPQRIVWDVPTVLQVHLQPRSCPFASKRWCDEGVVLDGAMP
jgi:hypothetical protein